MISATIVMVIYLIGPTGRTENVITIQGYETLDDCELSKDQANLGYEHRGIDTHLRPMIHCYDKGKRSGKTWSIK